jgi:hypothetical protein
MIKRQRIQAHRKRILKGLATTLFNDLYGNHSDYIYGSDHDDSFVEDEQELAEIRKAGEMVLRQIRGLVDR